MPEVNPGELNKRVTLRQNTANDPGISTEPNFTPIRKIWAKIDPLSGRAQEIAQQLNPLNSHTVTIRYRKEVTAVQFDLVYQQREFGITAVVDPNEKHEWMVLTCAERT